MTARTANLQKGMKAARKSVADFGSKAAASVSSFGGLMAATGKATAGVVDQFYIRPFMRAARAMGGIGKEIGGSLGWAGAGMVSPINRIAGGMGSMAAASARFGVAMGRVGLRGAASGFSMLGKATRATASGLRAGVNALGSFQARMAAMGAGGLFYKVAKLASNLGEQTSRAGVMFGAAAGDMVKQANLMSGAFGTSRSEFLAATSAMAGMFQGIGYGKKQSADLSTHFYKLATDLSSLANIPVAEALEKINAGLAGEPRPLRDVGVFMSEAAIKSKAAAMGIAKLGTELTEAQKMQARVAFITETLAYAQGDLARTANSAENATRGFMGRLQNLGETVGTALLPIVGAAMSQLQVGVEALSMSWQSMTAGIVGDQVNTVGAIGETSNAMGWLQKSVGFVADAFQTLKIGFYTVQSYITAGIGHIVEAFAGLGDMIDYALGKLGMARTGIGDYLKTYGADLARLSESQMGTAQSIIAGPAASDSVNAAFAAAQDRIKAMRTEAMKPGVDVTKLTPTTTATAKAAEPKFASASAAGSQEAANAALRSRYGAAADSKKPEEQTAKNTREMLELMRRGLGPRADRAGGGLAGVLGMNF